MKYKLFKVFLMLFSTQLSASVIDIKNNENNSIVNTQKTLIVGCGHINLPDSLIEGNHNHRNAFCADVADNTNYYPKRARQNEPNKNYGKDEGGHSDKDSSLPYWELTKADAELDITTSTLHLYPCVPKNNDVVVLERIWSTPLNHPNTIFNAATMLKVNGTLLIDIHSTYHFRLYSPKNEFSISNLIFPSDAEQNKHTFECDLSVIDFYDPKVKADVLRKNNEEYDNKFDLDSIDKQLKLFGFSLDKRPKGYNMDDDMGGLINYLNGWGFKNVIYFRNTLQPYTIDTENDLQTKGRYGDFIVATKSQTTQDLISEWRNSIRKNKDKIKDY